MMEGAVDVPSSQGNGYKVGVLVEGSEGSPAPEGAGAATKFLQSRIPNTRTLYASALRAFLEYTLEVPKEPRAELDSLASLYLSQQRDWGADLNEFVRHSKFYYAPNSTHTYRQIIQGFLTDNGVELTSLAKRKLRLNMPPNYTVGRSAVPTKEELRRILLFSSLEGKAFFLTLVNTGARVNEAYQLLPSDIHLDMNPALVSFRPGTTKGGRPRISFLGCEGKCWVGRWMEAHQNPYGLWDSTRLELESEWGRCLKKAKLDEKDATTKRTLYRLHTLRRYFRTNLAESMAWDKVEILLGHRLPGQGDAYAKYSEVQLGDAYRRAETYLYIDWPMDSREQSTEKQGAVEGDG